MSSLQNKTEMSHCVMDSYPYLCKLAHTRSEKKRHRLLKSASTSQLLSLIEIALNVVKGRCRVTKRQLKRMMPYASFIRRMSRARSETGARKLLLRKKHQIGSGIGPQFFAALLTPIILEIARSLASSSSKL